MSTDYCEAGRRVYEQELRGFLPARLFDAHVHLFDGSCLTPGTVFPERSIYRKFGGVFTIEQCLEWAAALLPEQEFHLNSFGHPAPDCDLEASAAYTGAVSDNRRFFGMALVSPEDSAESVVRRIESHRLIGYKPYHAFVKGKAAGEVTIRDMLPAAQMEVADARGLAVTLHIPRAARLADPLNQAHMVELCRRYPNARIVFAHIGRAYYLNGVVGLLDGIAACPNAFLDTAMVNHEAVLEYAFRNFPRDRILFGSDAPVAFLRGKSVEVNNQYAYLMGEPYEIGTAIYDAAHAVAFTYFYYEQLRGIRRAAERAGLSSGDIANLFFNNASRLFTDVAARNHGRRKD
ncbi:MAG: Amidohydrolase [Lentisphaerae bacterium ADurb.BinA184]|nr:MAG: Amidohydrolase [Lentisphaerae bacterium ADurb.BinA184]